MTKKLIAALMAATTIGATLAAPAQAQPDRHHRDRGDHQWRNWGGQYGYNGYRGQWRTGQRYTHWRDQRYYVTNYQAYGLPAPRHGYRSYRDSNGDIVMAAIATGLIASILTGR